jgi:hypothetical protein
MPSFSQGLPSLQDFGCAVPGAVLLRSVSPALLTFFGLLDPAGLAFPQAKLKM